MLSANAFRTSKSERAQKIFDTLGGTWTVPAGVTSLCAVAVGQGGGSISYTSDENYAASGSGGCLAWLNDIPVSPGEVLTAVINNTGTFLYRGGSLLMGAGSGENPVINGLGSQGGPGRGGFNVGGQCGGGGAAGYLNNASASTGGIGAMPLDPSYGPGQYGGGAGGSTTTPGGGVGLFGAGTSGTSSGQPGSGGSGSKFGGGGANGNPGGPGGLRLIWGAGRSFPYNAA